MNIDKNDRDHQSGTQSSLEDLPCAGKLAYPSAEAASGAVAYVVHRYGGKRPTAYVCRWCQRWHLASS